MPICHTCEDRRIGSKGIMSHRAAHRRRQERCVITLKSGTWVYDYRPEEEQDAED